MRQVRKRYRNRHWQLEVLRGGENGCGTWEAVATGDLLRAIHVMVAMDHLREESTALHIDPQRLRNLKTGDIITYVVGEKLYFTPPTHPPTWFG